MAKQIIWSPKSIADKKEIFSYWNWKNKSNEYSKKLNLLFNKGVQMIIMHPSIGRATHLKGVKNIIVRDYLIFYEDKLDEVRILTIWDSRQNPDKLQYKLK